MSEYGSMFYNLPPELNFTRIMNFFFDYVSFDLYLRCVHRSASYTGRHVHRTLLSSNIRIIFLDGIHEFQMLLVLLQLGGGLLTCLKLLLCRGQFVT